MRTCPRNNHIKCESTSDKACAGCPATGSKDFEAFLKAKGLYTSGVDLYEKTIGKKLKTRSYNHDCLDFVTDQVKHGVSFEEAVRKIGYYPKAVTPPDCGSNVKVPKGQQEVLLEKLLEEVKRIKLILTVGKEI